MRMASHLRGVVFFACLTVLVFSRVSLAQQGTTAKASGPELTWYDVKEVGVEGKGWTDTLAFYDRLPKKAEGKAPKSVWGLSHHSAGMCVRFTTDAPSIAVRWTVLSAGLAMPHMPATGVSGLDFYFKDKATGQWQFAANGRPAAVSNSATFSVPAASQYLLYLPLYNGVKSLEIGVPKGKTLVKAAPAVPRKPVVIYGTSITHGGCASRPGLAWTNIVGRQLDVPVINLGFSGSGRMEPEMCELINELDPSVFVLDCLWNMTPALVSERLEPFVRKLRQTHPDTPILLVEDSSFRNVCPTEKGRLLRGILEKLQGEGIKGLHFVSSEGMLGADTEGTVDGCHPNDLGMLRMAEAVVKPLRGILDGQK